MAAFRRWVLALGLGIVFAGGDCSLTWGDEKKAVTAVEKLGGGVRFDKDDPMKPWSVGLQGVEVADADMERLAALASIKVLVLKRAVFKDKGLQVIGALTHRKCDRKPIVASRGCYRLPGGIPCPLRRSASRPKASCSTCCASRYRAVAKQDKGKILDEFVALAGCHRKHAIRLLTAAPAAAEAPVVARRTYDEAVRQALVVLWEAADRICGKRLKAVLPGLVVALERHGHLDLDPEVRQRVQTVRAATIDRLLASVRGSTTGRKKRRAKSRSSKRIPVRTFADYGDAQPGLLEIDFVSHGGTSMQGVFLWSWVATDVCSGWTEAVPLVAREQSLVVEGLEVLRRQFPVPIKGIDSDNDSAFINDTLLGYCQQQKWQFARSRAYHKNDQAWIEQKNGAVVRRFVGYQRHAGVAAGQCLARLYAACGCSSTSSSHP